MQNNNLNNINNFYIQIQLENQNSNEQNNNYFNDIAKLEFKINNMLNEVKLKTNLDESILLYFKDSTNFLNNTISSLKVLLNKYEQLKEKLKTIKSVEEINIVNKNISSLLKFINSMLDFIKKSFFELCMENFKNKNQISLNAINEINIPSKLLIAPIVNIFSNILNETSRRKFEINNNIELFKNYIEKEDFTQKLYNFKHASNEDIFSLNKQSKKVKLKSATIKYDTFLKYSQQNLLRLKSIYNNLFENNNVIKCLTKIIEDEYEKMKKKPNKKTKKLLELYHKKLIKIINIYNDLEKINNFDDFDDSDNDIFIKEIIEKYKNNLEDFIINNTNKIINVFKKPTPSYMHSKYYLLSSNIRKYLFSRDINIKDTPKLKKKLDLLKLIYNISCILGYVNKEGKITNNIALNDVNLLENIINSFTKETKEDKKIRQVFREIKNFDNKNNPNIFTKNLIEKYIKILDDFVNNKTSKTNTNQINNFKFPPLFTNSKYNTFANRIRNNLEHKKLSFNNAFEAKKMLKSLKLLYNIFCVLGYVDEKGNITNKKALNHMNLLEGKLISFTKELQ